MKKIFYLMLLAVMIIAACQPKTKTVNLRAEADTIRSLEAQWSVALQNSDKEKIMSLYSSDAVSMSQNEPVVVGLQNIKKHIDSEFADTTVMWKTYSYKIDTIEVSASGDLAYVRGTDRMSTKTPKGLTDEVGKWIDIWKKTDGKWKDIVSIWNSDKK
jgi:ketosteroid isomerase-like protein